MRKREKVLQSKKPYFSYLKDSYALVKFSESPAGLARLISTINFTNLITFNVTYSIHSQVSKFHTVFITNLSNNN